MIAAIPLLATALLALSPVRSNELGGDILRLFEGEFSRSPVRDCHCLWFHYADATETGGCDESHHTIMPWAVISGPEGDGWIDPPESTTADAFDHSALVGPACLFMTRKKHGCDYETVPLNYGEQEQEPWPDWGSELTNVKMRGASHSLKDHGNRSGSGRYVLINKGAGQSDQSRN